VAANTEALPTAQEAEFCGGISVRFHRLRVGGSTSIVYISVEVLLLSDIFVEALPLSDVFVEALPLSDVFVEALRIPWNCMEHMGISLKCPNNSQPRRIQSIFS